MYLLYDDTMTNTLFLIAKTGDINNVCQICEHSCLVCEEFFHTFPIRGYILFFILFILFFILLETK